MVIVTLDNGEERKIKLCEHKGYKQPDGKYRVIFDDGAEGIVTTNPYIEPEETNG